MLNMLTKKHTEPQPRRYYFFSGASAPPRPVPCRAGKKKNSPRRTPNKKIRFFVETLNGCLPLEHGSDRRETLGKRVSDDLEHFIFRPQRKILAKKFWGSIFFQQTGALEELRRFERHW